MFTVEERDHVRERLLELAAGDDRVVAGALLGSLTLDESDRWGDLDLMFGVADGVPVREVLDEWTRAVVDELDGVHLFDLASGPIVYRVFLLPGALQLDLSVTPASEFGAAGPKFKLLFGTAHARPFAGPPDADELFGLAVHHAVRARLSVERGRLWLAEYWISGLRDCALGLACRRRGLPARHGRGFDDLPADVLAGFEGALAGSLERDALLRALRVAVEGLLRESGEAAAVAERVEPRLRELI